MSDYRTHYRLCVVQLWPGCGGLAIAIASAALINREVQP